MLSFVSLYEAVILSLPYKKTVFSNIDLTDSGRKKDRWTWQAEIIKRRRNLGREDGRAG